MLGFSSGELLLLVVATAALVGPKDLPRISRVAGRLAGRAIGYVQLARGQFDSVMQQSQARQVHKELQDTMAQLEAIRHEIRSISLVNPAPLTRSLVENPHIPSLPDIVGSSTTEKHEVDQKRNYQQSKEFKKGSKDVGGGPSSPINLQAQATAYARLVESEAVKFGSLERNTEENINGDPFMVLPVSAKSAGFLPERTGNAVGSDIMLEAILEAEIAHNAKDFFSKPENQMQ